MFFGRRRGLYYLFPVLRFRPNEKQEVEIEWRLKPILFLFKRIRSKFHLFNRLQIVENGGGVGVADLGVEVEGEAVGAFGVDQFRLQGQECLDRFELPHHGSTENIDSETTFQQELHDIAATHV